HVYPTVHPDQRTRRPDQCLVKRCRAALEYKPQSELYLSGNCGRGRRAAEGCRSNADGTNPECSAGRHLKDWMIKRIYHLGANLHSESFENGSTLAIERSSVMKCGPYSQIKLPNWPGV